MASSDEELKSSLVDLGSKLQKPPVLVKDLLALLHRVDICLSRVEQSPSKAIQNALSPTLKALVADELLKHADVDVKVSVASCISEITRITAPEVPYEDDKMKAVFQLIVSSFEGLADMSSQSYSKRTSILETVAKVRSSVVMLDLECDGLILEMFRHFIKTIRDYHPPNVYSCMESIMTRVIEESDEIPLDLVFCILDTVKKDNKEVFPRAQTLTKKVIETCADKLKPYIEIAMRTKGVSLADYDEVVSLICNEALAETVVQSEHTDASAVNVVDASKTVIFTADTVLTAEETQATVVNSIEHPPGACSELVTNNSSTAVEAGTLSGSSTLHDTKTSNTDKASEIVTPLPSASVSNPDGVGVETVTIASETITLNLENKDNDLNASKVDEGESTTEPKKEKIVKKRGRKAKAKKKTSEPKLAGKSSSSVKQLEELADSQTKDTSPSPKDSLNKASGHSSPKPLEAHDRASQEICAELDGKLNGSPKSKTVNSSSENHMRLDEKPTISKEDMSTPTADTSISKTVVSVANATVEKTNALMAENMDNAATIITSDRSQEVTAPTVVEVMEKIEPSAGKSLDPVGVLSEDLTVEDGPKTGGTKKRGRGKGKATLQKLAAQALVEDSNKEVSTSQKSSKVGNDETEMKETPKTSNKRKHTEPNSNESKDYGEELVGSKIKVWWPADKKFYKGVIESFDSVKKKHRVLYADGEVENLVLKKQRWEAMEPDEDSDTDEEAHPKTPATEKQHKATEANEGTSKKRLGRPPSIKSKSASIQPGRKPKNDGSSRDDSKGVKEKTDSSKKEEKSKEESGKRPGRPKSDVSKSTNRLAADEPSSNAAGKAKPDESKLNGKSTAEDLKPSGKLKGGDSKGRSDSLTASKLKDDKSSIKQRDTKSKGTQSGNATSLIKSTRKTRIKEPSKFRKAVSDAISLETGPKSGGKAPAKVEAERSGSDSEETVEEQTASPAEVVGSSKRKASHVEKGNKSGAKPEAKGKERLKH